MHDAKPARLWTPGYLYWLVSDTGFELSTALVGFAIPLLALMITDDPVLAGVMGATGLLARVLASLAGGVLADRHSRVSLMLIGAAIGLGLAALFTALSLAGWLGFTALLVLNLGFAIRNGLFGAADQAVLKDVVDEGALGRAQASNQGRDAVLSLAGAPLGGLLLGVATSVLGAAMMACQLVAAASAASLRHRMPTNSAEERVERRHFLTELREGFSWVFSRSDLRGTLIVSTLINLGFSAAVTTIVYSLQQTGATPATIGLVTGGMGLGMLAGAALAPLLVPRVPAGWLGIVGILAVGAGMLLLPAIEQPVAVTVVMAACMLGVPALNAALLGYFMVATPRELIGRASSALMVCATAAMPLAPLIAGFGLTWIGRAGTLIVAAAICLGAALLALLTPGLRRIPAERGWAAHAAAQVDGA